MPTSRTLTPRARARSGETEVSSSTRASRAVTSSAMTPDATSAGTVSGLTTKMDPNSTVNDAPVVAVRSESKWKTLGDLIADARSRPYGISVGNSGAGSHTHISSVALFKAAGVEVLEVPFPAAQTVPSLLGGHVDALVQLPAALSNHVKNGTVRLVAALTSKRDPALPDVPTAQEQGFDVSLEAWRGIAAPRGTPKTVVAALEAAIRRTVESPGFVSASQKLGVTPAYMPAEEFGALITGEDATLARLMQLIGLEKP